MSQDIVERLRYAANNALGPKGLTSTLVEESADEIVSLRASLKEAEASRDEIIEECAKVADAHAKEMRGHTEEEAAAEEIAKGIRALKASRPKPQKNDCQGEDPISILKEALKQANSYIDSTPLMPGNSYKEIKAVIRSALECDAINKDEAS